LPDFFLPQVSKTSTGVVHISCRRGSTKEEEESPTNGRSLKGRLEEAVSLAQAIDLNVVYSQIIQLNKIVPATLMGKGNVEAVGAAIKAFDIGLVVIDHPLTPIQQRNLEKAWKCKVIDRTGLIIEIFGSRARTAEGGLQVELAALNYQRSRLVRSWTHLERQRGGFGFIGGPGESQLELDRRLIDDRIMKIKKELDRTKRTRKLHRTARQRVPYPIVALVGYTNAGKSTLFNRITQANVFAEDLLFATLDPTMRQVKLPSGRQIILSDTVGFISDLPTQLIAAFRATLEEVVAADLILHIRDVAHPDTRAQRQDVLSVLEELGISHPLESGIMLEVCNKVDSLPPNDLEILENRLKREEAMVAISALSGYGVEVLLARIDEKLGNKGKVITLDIPAIAGDILAWCYRQGVIVSRCDEQETIHLTLRLTEQEKAKLVELFGKQVKVV
jgi:GTP-binding protein HflX